MQVNRSTRSVASGARRRQIIEATTHVIGTEGYAGASYARIAEHAGLSSTRLISYHFTDKAELIGAVVESVVESIGESVGAKVRRADGPAAMLDAYIRAVVGFIDTRRAPMRALAEILLAGAMAATRVEAASNTAPLEDILRAGQRGGEFRDFGVLVMATTIQRSMDGLPFRLAADPDLDCTGYAEELVQTFRRATRRDFDATR